jgi:glycosyltransferase involved in cell wall biosynthesis
MPEPEIAVVIPTRGRESRLAFALEALAAQTLAPDRFEVVVVRGEDDGPLAPAPPGLNVRFLSHPESTGAAAQRNVGWRAAGAPLVAFTDDDTRPMPDWLERLSAAAEADGDAVVGQGRTEPDPDEVHLLYGLARSLEVTEPGWFETCNIAYPRALLERLDGFDERFPGVWGEDTDLGLRALAAGARLEFAEDAVVFHAVLPRTLRSALRETSRYDAIPLVCSIHPEQRRRAFPHRLVKDSHASFLLALAAVVCARRMPAVAVAAGGAYLWPHLRRHLATNPLTPRSLARLALHMPAPVMLEAAEIAYTLRGAVRYGVLLV